MKKSKIFGKKQIITSVLILCLAAAVWLNMKYADVPVNQDISSSDSNTDLIYEEENLGTAVETGTGVNYIETARQDRNKSRDDTITKLKETLGDGNPESEKAISKLFTFSEKEKNIETVLKSKGFKDALTILSEDSVTVIIPVEKLLTSETLQIQDAVKSEVNIDLKNIKIITLK